MGEENYISLKRSQISRKKGRGRTIALIRIRKETKGKEGRDLKEEEGNLEE